MISRITRVQLILFVIITLIGASYVGGKYAQLDRLFIDRTYSVTADLEESGGIFAGAEVTYRGIAVGKVGKLTFTEDGVRARLDIEKSAPNISADLEAVVANKSAIGEQYIDLQPRTSAGPYLKSGTSIGVEDTRVPIDTTTLLTDVNAFVASVGTEDLRTVVTELGIAFEDAGPEIATILDSSAVFIGAAQDNLEVTRQLIRDSSTVLQTQIDKGSQIQSFSRDLALFSDTLVGADPDLRRLIDTGTGAAAVINAVVSENSADLSAVLAGLRGPTEIADQNVAGLQALLLLYPYVVQGAYTVATPTGDGEYNASFGNILALDATLCGPPGSLPPAVANPGYRDIRPPHDISDVTSNGPVFDPTVGCDTTVPGAEALVPRSSTKAELNRSTVGSPAGQSDLQWLLLGTTQ
jgi:phospholipid/cholesterol/gamma-HCH transport system substrate-binding protein